MRYHKYYPVDVVNGPGTRVTLFVSGCEHHCPGCYNSSTWPLDSGHLFDEAMMARLIADLKDQRIIRRGLSLSGGDPLHPANVPDVLALVKRVRQECPEKDIWCWTGYRLENLSATQLAVVDFLNVLVDGRFEQDKFDPALIWRGSANQVIHYLR